MLGVTCVSDKVAPKRRFEPQRRLHCYQPAEHVTSASCVDGHATAIAGASRRVKSRRRKGPRPCNPSSLIRPLEINPTSASRISRRNLTKPNFRKHSPAPSRLPRTARHNQPAAIAAAVADGAGAEAVRKLLSSPAPVVQRVKPPKQKLHRKAAQAAPKTEATKQPKGAVVLSIGLPGSGKSTWFKRHNILPLSSDMVRILLFDDATEQGHQDLVFSTLRTMLRARLLARRPWNYLDATNLSPHERRSWVKLAHDFGYEVHAVFFDVPPEVCMERNRRRERNVPEDIMQRMAGKLRPPKFEEGFAKITVVRLKKKEGEQPHQEPRQELPIEPDEDEPPTTDDSEY